ncbi:hypothetical protein GF343_02225 [Candidatus Woesearchaeota archaeon]|nr:hypothetical protein [Candidatus Woesearchaeota archaeon]
MSEKTPFIVLTVVFVVGMVGFVMMMTDANTGAVSIYKQTREAAETPGGDPGKYWKAASGGRAIYGGIVQQGETQANIIEETGAQVEGGQAYTREGQATGNLGIAGTTSYQDKKRSWKRLNENERGCYVYNQPVRSGQLGMQYAAGTEQLKHSLRTLECYQSGQQIQTAAGQTLTVMVRSAIQNRDLIWGADDTWCCFKSGLRATY